MSYLSLRFEIDAARADVWSDALLGLGALSVDLSDPHAGTDLETPQYGEPGAPDGSLWPVVRIDALFAGETGAAELSVALGNTAAELSCPLPLFETAPVAERDWVRETQAQFGPIAITDDFWIVPTWSTPPAAARYVLRLDPGLAFGTGSHPTTRLCLLWLREHVRASDTVLDYGCGSGILLLAARLLGAGAQGKAFGTDIDPQALIASRENAAANRLDAAFVVPENLPVPPFDLVIANILANPLRALAPLLASRTAPGGRLILSGILESQQEELCACYTPWFDIAPWQTLDGWVLLSGTRQ